MPNKSSAKRVRWECPAGDHAGVLGSTRPPMDSVVRYCLPCSQKTGRLVKRTAPALERKRAAKAQQRSTAPARAAESVKRRALIECHDSLGRRVVVDLMEEVESCCRMLDHDPASVTIARTSKSHYGESGRGWPSENRVHFTVGPKATAERLCEVALHEVLHVADGTTVLKDRGKNSYHGPRFKRALFEAARRRWPEIREFVDDISRWERSGKAYDLDDAIVEALRATTSYRA